MRHSGKLTALPQPWRGAASPTRCLPTSMWDSFRLGATTSLWNQAGANLQSNLASVSHFCLSCVLLAPSPESIPTNKLLEQEFLSLLTFIYLAALGLSWAVWDLSLQCTGSSYIVPLSFACMLSRSNSSRPHRLSSTRPLCPYDFLGKNTGVGFHFLCQRIISTQGLNLRLLCLLHWAGRFLTNCATWEALSLRRVGGS